MTSGVVLSLYGTVSGTKNISTKLGNCSLNMRKKWSRAIGKLV